MIARWCRVCGSFLINPEKQLENEDKLDSIPIEYRYFIIFILGMMVGALIGTIV